MTRFWRITVLSAAIALPLIFSCGKSGGGNPASSSGGGEQHGSIDIRARIVSQPLAKSAASTGVLATVADSLVLRIFGGGADTMRFAHKFDFARPTVDGMITGIPVGANRTVEVSAVDKNGVQTHIDSITNRAPVNIEKMKVVDVYAILIPARGSINLQFISLPTNSSVYARFDADDESFTVSASTNRETRTFLNLDTIPHLTAGTLTVIIYSGANATGDTLRIASNAMTFNARIDQPIVLEFLNYETNLEMNIDFYSPGGATGSYDYKTRESAITETGELVITEVMWSASNDNYIELYNPADTAFTRDTLRVDFNDANPFRFLNVEIEPRGFFVIARQDLPFSDVSSAFTITSGGNWITVRHQDGTIIDRVICGSYNNTIGWPTMTSTAKRAIELAPDMYNATANNYGKNWKATEAIPSNLIPGMSTNNYGTPGR